MSLHAWIDVALGSASRDNQFVAVAALLASGWRLGIEGHVQILLPGDDDAFDWKGISAASLDWRAYLAEKVQFGETAGLTLQYSGTEVGIDLLCRKDGSLGFSLSINTVYLTDLRAPDFSWYLTRLLRPLGREVSSVRCEFA